MGLISFIKNLGKKGDEIAEKIQERHHETLDQTNINQKFRKRGLGLSKDFKCEYCGHNKAFVRKNGRFKCSRCKHKQDYRMPPEVKEDE